MRAFGMTNKSTSILYALSDWYNNSKVKSATIYKGKNGEINLVAKNKYGSIVYRKRLRLFGRPKPASQMWWAWHRPTIEESFATSKEVDAYFKRRKGKGKRGGSSKKFDLQEAILGGAEINKLLDDTNFWSEK